MKVAAGPCLGKRAGVCPCTLLPRLVKLSFAILLAGLFLAGFSLAGQAARAESSTKLPGKLRTITTEFERNPEALADILSRWLERAEPVEQKAA